MRVFMSAALALSFLAGNVWGAEIEFAHSVAPGKEDKIVGIKLEGEIVPGDAEKLFKFIEDNYNSLQTKYNFFFRVLILHLASKGGDASEAMKIGRMVRRLRLEVAVPTYHPQFTPKPIRAEQISNLDNDICASACFLVFAGGVYRDGNHIGLHRPYVSRDQNISDVTYEEQQKKAMIDVRRYLEDMEIPTYYIDLMMSRNSQNVYLVTQDDVFSKEHNLAGYSPSIEEFTLRECTTVSEEEYAKAAVASRKGAAASPEEKAALERTDAKMEAAAHCQNDALAKMQKDAISREIHLADAGLAAFHKGDYATAYRELKPLVEQGNTDAQMGIGAMHYFGKGMPQDYAEAAKWMSKPAEAGDVEGQFLLGSMYEKGQGVPQDYSEAAKWYRKAAEQRNDQAQFILGEMYDNGRALPQDHAEAIEWYQKSAGMGNTKAFSLLYEKFRPLAEQGQLHAQYELGELYSSYYGEWKDYAEAVKWYRSAADQGFAGAQYKMGFMYEVGCGVSQDDSEAVKWYRKAADQGDVDGQERLGWMYQEGRGVPQDNVHAYMWYDLAATQRAFIAEESRDPLAKKMTPSQIAEAKQLVRNWKPKDKD